MFGIIAEAANAAEVRRKSRRFIRFLLKKPLFIIVIVFDRLEHGSTPYSLLIF
jgi:hypothetical protein